jgi:hypothetical protein
LLLALLVNVVMPSSGFGAPAGAPRGVGSTAEVRAQRGTHHGAQHWCGADGCDACEAETETGLARPEHAVPLPRAPHAFLTAHAPVADGYLPAPFRPPTTR